LIISTERGEFIESNLKNHPSLKKGGSMKINWLMGFIIFLFLLTVFIPKNAFGIMEKMEIEELTAQADLIVVGEVKKIESQREEGGGIFTYVTIAVEQSLKGKVVQEITLRYLGGEVDEIGLWVSDMPEFQLGEKVKVFLKGEDIYHIVGAYQGKLTLVAGKALKPAYDYDGRHWFLPNPMGEPYLINPNCADSQAGTPDEQIAVIKDGAARAWMNEGNANFIFTYSGTTTKLLPDDGVVGSYNGFNEIMFVNDPTYQYFIDHPTTIAVTFGWYYTETKEIFECDMAFSDVNFTFNGVGQPTSQEMDIWGVAAHELGHFLRLGHSSYLDATMYAYISKGETKKRDLHSDDIAGIQYIYGAAANTNPVLTSGYVTPTSGYTGTEFSFYVNYYDENGDAPTSINVYIDDTPYTMSLYSGSAANGAYRYQTNALERGTHNFYFECQEANGGSDKEPVLWGIGQPTVLNKAPTLSDGYVTPTDEFIYEVFNFYVTYVDDDGDTPTMTSVYIDDVSFSMDLYSGTGENGTYHYSTDFIDAGEHNFYFYFEDGFGGTKRLPSSGKLFLTAYKCGDVNVDNEVNVSDVIYLINFLFKGGPAPSFLDCADANGDTQVNVSDVIYLINFLFKGGPSPNCV
jgi:hypothetical protein